MKMRLQGFSAYMVLPFFKQARTHHAMVIKLKDLYQREDLCAAQHAVYAINAHNKK